MLRNYTATLRRVWCYEEFREGQEEVVSQLLSGRDALVLWATGSGKYHFTMSHVYGLLSKRSEPSVVLLAMR